jgi:hypothetical protein
MTIMSKFFILLSISNEIMMITLSLRTLYCKMLKIDVLFMRSHVCVNYDKRISMIEQSLIFFRVKVSIVSLSTLFLDKTRIMFSRFMIFKSTQNDVLFLASAENEIEIEILISIN